MDTPLKQDLDVWKTVEGDNAADDSCSFGPV